SLGAYVHCVRSKYHFKGFTTNVYWGNKTFLLLLGKCGGLSFLFKIIFLSLLKHIVLVLVRVHLCRNAVIKVAHFLIYIILARFRVVLYIGFNIRWCFKP